MLELDHAICFVRAREDVDLDGFTIEPGRIHTGQGTRNVRVMFERSYLEVLWVYDPAELAATGLDVAARCARPATAYPFGCVLRGTIPESLRSWFVPYPLPDAPGVVLQRLADQPLDAPFIGVFERDDLEAAWPARRAPAAYLTHSCGATRIVRATFSCPAAPPIDALPDVQFAAGAPRLDLDLGGIVRTFEP